MFKRIVGLTIIAVFFAMTTTPSSAKDKVYGSWNGPKNVVLVHGVVPYLKAIEKETGGSESSCSAT